jgi:acetylornithine deacetylase
MSDRISNFPETSLEILAKLISFDTTSRNSNLDLIDWVRGYLGDIGVDSSLIFDSSGSKANLLAGIGPDSPGGFLLSGHTDVVPVDGQSWSTDPFSMVLKESRVYGRGACDMKGFIAVALDRIRRCDRSRLRVPIVLALTYDEEVGCQGVPSLIEHVEALHIKPRICVVGEPTEMRIVTAQKGNRRYRCHVRGHECHSALTHQGVNAIEMAARIVVYLETMARKRRFEGPSSFGFEPPYTTIQTGVIHGGTAVNIVPKDCHFDFEYRFVPNDNPDSVFNDVRAYADKLLREEMVPTSGESEIEFVLRSELFAFDTEMQSDAISIVAQCLDDRKFGKIGFGTEGGWYSSRGIPSVVCGPGSIEQAHKPDEWIELEQLTACEHFVDRIIGMAEVA